MIDYFTYLHLLVYWFNFLEMCCVTESSKNPLKNIQTESLSETKDFLFQIFSVIPAFFVHLEDKASQ